MLLPVALAGDAPVDFDPWIDGGVTLGAAAAMGGMVLGLEKVLGPTGEVSDPIALDSWVSPRYNAEASRVSDGLLIGTAAFATGGTLLDSWGSDEPLHDRTGVLFEAVALSLVVTEGLKLSVRRPRPYTRLAPGVSAEVDAKMQIADSALSFPSGHTSTTAAFSFAAARMWHLAHPESNKAWLMYTGAAALSVGVAELRVKAGAHYPTDVAAGLLIGCGVALSVVEWHRTEASKQVSSAVGPRSFQLRGRF